MLLRDLRVDRAALLGAKNEQTGGNDQRRLDGDDDRNLTREGMLKHGRWLRAASFDALI
jgi:hypothetical protein